MKVNISDANPALVSLFENPNQVISLDANILIPPNRNRICKMGFGYPLFKDIWLDPLTNYDPKLDNKDDRGEVKSLSYIAVKGLLYFAAHDNTALQLIEKASLWSTGLDNVQAIHMYELIYYLYSNSLADKKSLRMLYKYQYYLTDREKATNLEWGEFIKMMGTLYL